MAMTISLALAMGAAADFNAQLDTFPIGFWNYAPIEVFDEAKVQEWQDAGITLTMGPEYAATPENIQHMKQILDWAQARGIMMIICDPRSRARVPLPDDYAEKVAQAVADFGQHPATFGFHILDEPGKDAFAATCEAVRITKDAAPHLSPFVNLLPWYVGASSRVGFDDWGEYLDTFVEKSGVDFLCYDCYSQMNPEQSGWTMYFRNLNEYRESAKRKGVPFWTTILSVGHFHYKCPDEDDIRWQFNSAVAYGAQGILYFFFYMRQSHDNYRLSPIDEFWDRTPVFESLKRTNKGFVKRYGRLFLDLKFEKAMQWPEALSGCEVFEPDELVSEIRGDPKCPLILSRFTDPKGRPWIVLVNNTTDRTCKPTLVLNGENTRVFGMDWSNQEHAVGTGQKDGKTTLTHWLAPGQMEVYRIEPGE
ncbi:MAG: hypothetical protein GY851_13965 [bacterium]|nr:hypothetical protein [bacterium]